MTEITFREAVHNRRFLQAADILALGGNPFIAEDPNESISAFEQDNIFDILIKEKAFDLIYALVENTYIQMDLFESGLTGIHKSIINHLHEDEDSLQFLQKFLSNVTKIDEEYNDETLLSWAVRKDKPLSVLKVIIDAGCAITFVDRVDNSLLHQIVFQQSDETLLPFLVDAGLEVDGVNILGETALHTAVKNRKEKYIPTLLACGADPNLPDTVQKSHYYYALVQQRSLAIYEIFAGYCPPNFDQFTLDGSTLLFDFISNIYSDPTDLKLVEKMLEHGADLSQEVINPYGVPETPLDLVAQKSCELMQCILNKEHIDINAQDRFGNTVLHKVCARNVNYEQAVARNMYRTVKFLLAEGADMAIKNDLDQTPLMLASDDNMKAKIATLLILQENE